MPIQYIPPQYRRPAMGTMGYFAQSMQPLMQNLFGAMLGQEMWKKRLPAEMAGQGFTPLEEPQAAEIMMDPNKLLRAGTVPMKVGGKWYLKQPEPPMREPKLVTLGDVDFALSPTGTLTRIQPTTKPSALEQKITEVKNAYPWMDEQDVRKVALGTRKVVVNQLTGEFQLVDVGTQEALPLKGAEIPTEEIPAEQARQTIYDMADLATGPVSQAKEWASIASGFFEGPIAEKTIRARQFIRSAQNDLIRSLSINPRFPVGEINRLKEEINISPKFFDNPKMFKSRARAVDDYLRRRLEKEQRVVADRTMPVADRRAAAKAASDIRNFLKILGVPSGPKVGDIEDGYRFKGGDPADPNNWEKVR